MRKMMICKKCGEEKNAKLFTTKKAGTTEYKCHICIKCSSSRAKKYKNDNKLKAVAYKGGKCLDCGYIGPASVYDFHHLDPKEKERKPARLWGCVWEKIKIEIDKCVLLCANCHRLRHENDK